MTKKKGYLIPDVIETEDRVCVSFTLPDLPEYRQAALYQIISLGKWWAWEHDIPSQGDTAAVEVGRYLLPFLNNIQITPGECPSMGDNYVMNVQETAPMEVTVTFRDDTTSVLDLTDCCEQVPPYFRRDVINGGLEFSFDGVNWEPITIPDGEPPDWPIFDGPPPGEVWVTPPDGTDKACRVANSIIDEFKEQAEALKSRIDFNAGIILSLAQFTTAVITAGVGFYFAGPAGAAAGAAGSQAFWEVIMSATDTILEMFQGYTALSYDNLFSDPVKWREVKCWYYCNLSSDGLLDYAGYQMVLSSAEAARLDNPTDDFYKFMVEQIKLFGTDGPNQSYEKWMNTEDDCTDCTCPYDWVEVFDFTVSAYGWVPLIGSHVPGTGFVHGDSTNSGGTRSRSTNINYYDMDEFEAVRIETTYSRTAGSFSSATRTDLIFGSHEGAGAILKETYYPSQDEGTDLVYTWNGSQNISDQIQLYHRASWGNWSGSTSISKVKIFGKGSNPFT